MLKSVAKNALTVALRSVLGEDNNINPPIESFLLLEDGSFMLLEDNGKIGLEN